MNEELRKGAERSYRLAEQKASHYFLSLLEQVKQKSYVPALTKDIQLWKHNHIHKYSMLPLFSRKKRKPDTIEYDKYISWLNYTNKLDHYLERSISYIFLRDLGKALDSDATQTRIHRVVNRVKKHLIDSTAKDCDGVTKPETFSIAGLYRLAQKEGIESTIIWLLNKLKLVASNLPEEMEVEQAQRKLIKIIAGVLFHAIEEMSDGISSEERARKLDVAIRLGYSYGLTYPFIDDLLDAQILSDQEKKQYATVIRTALITWSVPEVSNWPGKNADLMRYIHSELVEAFDYLKEHQGPETRKHFFEQAYVFFHSQEVDRVKDLANPDYTNEELYIPIIIKSSSSRLIVRSIINAPDDEGFENRTFYYGIYNQLADDFADMFADLKSGAVTPYTYYLKYHNQRPDLLNPFELYWTVIAHLIHKVYNSDRKTCEVILDRAINGLKRCKERLGSIKYNEIMELLASGGDPQFYRVIQKMVRKADDVDFFDKLLRDHIITVLKNERKERAEFFDTIETVRKQINNMLPIRQNNPLLLLQEPIIDAANYCLASGGKRLRPIITWVMGVHAYGLEQQAIIPLIKSLEYMHTASLIFDDLPSQDNAALRRGRPTLHQVYNNAIAELTGLFLTQKAVEEQASLDQFDAKTVLALIQYSARVAGEMCKGQALDLEYKGKPMTFEQLNQLCFYKTGLAFEATLILPAILAHAKGDEMAALKKFAYHAGIAFQIKDDLLDVEGHVNLLGKAAGKDTENNNSTFVSILGLDGAKKAMWDHYCLAFETLQEVPRKTTFLKNLLSFIVNRDY